MKIIVINGPNLDKLGNRESEHYGSISLVDLRKLIESNFPDTEFVFFHSNLEGELVNKLHEANNNYDGILINPGGYAHTSVAIHDALALCSVPKVEVHLSNIHNREEFRQHSITARKCDGYISGLREISYLAGVIALIKLIEKKKNI